MAQKILIIEDEEHMRNGLKTQLEKDGYMALAAGTGTEGLDIALTQQPNLIILDYFMPEMNGLQILQKLRDDERTKTTPVIVLTNMTDNELTMQVQQYHVADFLIKTDWTFSDISERVKKYVAQTA